MKTELYVVWIILFYWLKHSNLQISINQKHTFVMCVLFRFINCYYREICSDFRIFVYFASIMNCINFRHICTVLQDGQFAALGNKNWLFDFLQILWNFNYYLSTENWPPCSAVNWSSLYRHVHEASPHASVFIYD